MIDPRNDWTKTPMRILRAAASRHGMRFEEYLGHLQAGKRWCTGCREFHELDAFFRDSTRGGGISHICSVAKQKRARELYKIKPRRQPGDGRHVAPRVYDKAQARHRIRALRIPVLNEA